MEWAILKCKLHMRKNSTILIAKPVFFFHQYTQKSIFQINPIDF